MNSAVSEMGKVTRSNAAYADFDCCFVRLEILGISTNYRESANFPLRIRAHGNHAAVH